ncbi:hypothetical protein CHU92_05970 [Flavobacterium cyanobacteriorum]|uniref:DUF4890 domain-containing protein n=1 Tax=Flavobacterium cyanobacteriorum TaxID=2022802 RepID=A0A255Z9X6_9FLAO|nr:hypothetical protein [Flavobacterium cyanobacteriorum]OYQ38256.1 hypothetical protein CHU92_05970 [Flavobacterium cyanobacteriorum]
MKTWILAVVMAFAFNASAQQRQEQLKPEQKAELQAKRLALALDLNEKQQKDVRNLMLEKVKKASAMRTQLKADREAGKKLTADERYALQSKKLDEQIALKAEMKKILTQEQFDKWEKLKEEHREKITKRHKNLKNAKRR